MYINSRNKIESLNEKTLKLEVTEKKNDHVKSFWKKIPFPLFQNWQMASIAVYNSEML